MKVDAIIGIIISKKNAYCIQETWLDRNFIKDINGYTMFHHGLISQKYNRGQKGVAIILSPEFPKAYHNFGSVPPIIPVNKNNKSFGRFVALKLNISVKRR